MYNIITEPATWITYFRFLSIAASPTTAIIGAVCLKSAIGFRISVFCLGTVIRSNRFRYFCIYFLKTLLRIRSVSQFIAPLGRRGISAPVLQGKKSWLVITIDFRLAVSFAFRPVFQPPSNFRSKASKSCSLGVKLLNLSCVSGLTSFPGT